MAWSMVPFNGSRSGGISSRWHPSGESSGGAGLFTFQVIQYCIQTSNLIQVDRMFPAAWSVVPDQWFLSLVHGLEVFPPGGIHPSGENSGGAGLFTFQVIQYCIQTSNLIQVDRMFPAAWSVVPDQWFLSLVHGLEVFPPGGIHPSGESSGGAGL